MNVIGFASANLGIGVACRNSIRTLEEMGVPTAVIDIDSRDGRSGHDTTFAHLQSGEAPYSVNLFHLNPPDAVRLLQARPAWLNVDDAFNATVPFWELPKLPPGWIPFVEAVDLVLAPTEFIRSAVAASAPSATCLHYPQLAYVPNDIQVDKRRWGLPEDCVLFLTVFDMTSDIDRKNPYAAIDAFTRSGLDAHEARLVIKLSHADYSRAIRRQADELRRQVAQSERLTLVEGAMSYREVLALTASCDVYVSLHRSEGLGLNLLESMSLGKPVIATGWSGNMDYMTDENACLVPFELVPVASSHPAYSPEAIGQGQRWAEPDGQSAAVWMNRLARDRALMQAIGTRARADMALLRESPARHRVLENLQERVDSLAGEGHAERAARLRALEHVRLETRLRRAASSTLRRAGLR